MEGLDGDRSTVARLREARAQTGCERHSRPTTNTCARSAGPLVPAAREDVGTGCLARKAGVWTEGLNFSSCCIKDDFTI